MSRAVRSVEKDRCMSVTLFARNPSLMVAEAAMAPSDRRILSTATGQVVPSARSEVLAEP